MNKFSLHIYYTTMYQFCIYNFSILRFHVVNLIIVFIARLMAISALMATINTRSRTTDNTAMARVAQKWLQLKKYWYYRFQSYCIQAFFSCPECTHESCAVFRRTAWTMVLIHKFVNWKMQSYSSSMSFSKHSLHPPEYFQSQQHTIHSPNARYTRRGIFNHNSMPFILQTLITPGDVFSITA